VKNFYGESSLFIGARGYFKKTASIWPLRVFRKTCVHSDVLRVTFFTRIRKFSWNRIVGVNPLPRGASVGEFKKNLTPSKRRVCRIHEISFQVMCENDSRIWLLRMNLLSISRWLKLAKI
jgi:hypothetical protein